MTVTGGPSAERVDVALQAERPAARVGDPVTNGLPVGTAVLAAAGIAAAAVVFALTGDVIWSAVPALLTVAAVRRVRQHH